MARPSFAAYRSILLVATSLIMANCAHEAHQPRETYQERVKLIKEHADSFYSNLKANRVESAIQDNRKIEAIALQMGDTARKRTGQPSTPAAEQDVALLSTVNATAATNWLALGQYYAIKRQYPQALATYRHLIDSYTNSIDRPYREQALRALKDLGRLHPPTATANP